MSAGTDCKDMDAIVFDIQDVGARFYTYSCTMLYALEGAAHAGKSFYVLDRPNPINGSACRRSSARATSSHPSSDVWIFRFGTA